MFMITFLFNKSVSESWLSGAAHRCEVEEGSSVQMFFLMKDSTMEATAYLSPLPF